MLEGNTPEDFFLPLISFYTWQFDFIKTDVGLFVLILVPEEMISLKIWDQLLGLSAQFQNGKNIISLAISECELREFLFPQAQELDCFYK